MVIKKANQKVKNLNVVDVQFIKLSVFFFAFFLASFLGNVLVDYRWLWLILFVIFAIKPIIKFFKKQ